MCNGRENLNQRCLSAISTLSFGEFGSNGDWIRRRGPALRGRVACAAGLLVVYETRARPSGVGVEKHPCAHGSSLSSPSFSLTAVQEVHRRRSHKALLTAEQIAMLCVWLESCCSRGSALTGFVFPCFLTTSTTCRRPPGLLDKNAIDLVKAMAANRVFSSTVADHQRMGFEDGSGSDDGRSDPSAAPPPADRVKAIQGDAGHPDGVARATSTAADKAPTAVDAPPPPGSRADGSAPHAGAGAGGGRGPTNSAARFSKVCSALPQSV